MVEIIFCDNIFCEESIYGLTQWDKGQYLRIGGLNTTDGVKVQFSLQNYEGSAVEVESTIEDGFVVSKIPQFILENMDAVGAYYSAYVFICESESDSCCKTTRKVKLVIRTRPKPEDYIYTEDELKTYEELEGRIESLEKGGVSDEKIEGIIESYLEENPVEVDLTDYVKNTDYATAEKAGVVKVSNLDYGIEITNAGILRIRKPSEWNILNGRKSAVMSPVTLGAVDLVVKEVLKSPTVEWTEEEKASARNLLNALEKPTTGNGVIYLDAGLNVSVVKITDGTVASAYQIPRYAKGGVLPVGTPTMDEHATTKKYVDDLFKSITDFEEVSF